MLTQDPNEPGWIRWIRNPRVRRALILTLLWVFMGVVLVRFRAVLLPFALALLLAFIVDPLVELLSRQQVRGKNIPRGVAIIGLYLVFGTVLWIFGSWAVSQVAKETAGLGRVTKSLLVEGRAMTGRLLDAAEAFAVDNALPWKRAEIQQLVEQNMASTADEVSRFATSLFIIGRDVVGGAVKAVFGAFLVLMLTAFLSMDKARIIRFFHSLVPPEYQAAYENIQAGMGVGLAGVVRGQVLICLANGVLTFIGLWLLDVKLPLILATVAATFSLIPIFGSILSTLPIVAMALTDSFAKGVFALLWVIGIHLVEANLLNPKIMGDAAKIHPVLVVFALIVGEQTAGLMGALFAVPVASVLVTLFKFFHRRALAAEGGTADIPSAEA